jgi:DNA-binding transcriptional LysR family regulator
MSDRIVSMQTFVRAVDSGSLSAAARALGKSLAAVSRTVTQLEARLGVRLLHRSTRKLAPTEAGIAFYESARRILAEIDEAELAVGGGAAAPRGTLSVTAPLLFGRLHVAPVVAEFLRRNAEVSAQLMLTDRNVNLAEEGVDVAVRIGRLDDSSLIARKLGEMPRIVCASPGYLRRHGTPTAPEDLRDHECLRFTGFTPGREWTFVRDGREVRVPAAGRFACNVVEPAVEIARGDGGILMALGYQVADDLAAGRLVRILEAFEPPPLPVSAMFLSPRLMAARVRAFLELLSDSMPPRIAGPALTRAAIENPRRGRARPAGSR